MNTPQQIHYPASAIAAALGLSKRAVLCALADFPPTGTARTGNGGGIIAQAWCPASLPAPWQTQLADAARTRGFRDAAHLLSEPSPRWSPPVPLAEVSQASLDKAARLQRALRPMLERGHDPALSEAEFEARAVDAYRREFGHVISARHWRRLFKRTIERAGGAEDWTRLEIFLDENAGRRRAPAAAAATATMDFHDLSLLLAAFKNPARPTPGEVDCLWLRAFELFEQRLADGKPEKRTRRALVSFLHERAPFLADSREGLTRQFVRKLARWRASDRDAKAVADGRREHSGNFRAPELKKQDKDTIVGTALLSHGGSVAPAWRELMHRRELSEELSSHYLANPASKSHVPRRIMQEVKFEVAMLEDIHHGPRQAKLNGPHIDRDWSDTSAGDWFQADDCTLPVYYYEPDGKGWFTLWRGQLLLMVDVRSQRILNYALLSERNYNSLAIRTLITKTCDAHLLPRCGFYFERGIWSTSKILVGDKHAPISMPEAEIGLRGLFGLQFRHAGLPRAKVVEWILSAMQNRMEGEPGYCGRDERHDKYERFQRLKLDIENRRVNPQGVLYNAEQWLNRIDELCADYNAEPQEGKMLAGLSPDVAFSALQLTAAPRLKLEPSFRYLFAHHKRPARITGNGIRLQFGKQVYIYRNAITGRLIGQTVLAWFNPETPDIITVTDMNRENVFAVERAPSIPAMSATPEQMAVAHASINAHTSHAKAYYRSLRSAHLVARPPALVDGATARLGVEMEQQQEAVNAAVKARRQTRATAQKAANRLGVELPAEVAEDSERATSAARLAELLSEPDEETPTQKGKIV